MTSHIAQEQFGGIAPKFAELTDSLLFDQIWQREQLTPSQRSLITVAALIALNRNEQLPFHFKKAVENGISIETLSEVITHLAFYCGWPCAASALDRLRHEQSEHNNKTS